MSQVFEQVVRFEKAVQQGGGGLLLHCERGLQEHLALVVFVLMANYKMSLREAWIEVFSKRAIVKPNTGFVFQLLKAEKMLFGQNSVRVPNRASLKEWGEVHLGDLLEPEQEAATESESSVEYGGVSLGGSS